MDSSERLLDLLAYLLRQRRPVSREEIFQAMPEAYSGNLEAQDRKLSRDNERLREMGLPLVIHRPDADERSFTQSLDRAAFYLPDVALSPEERAALFATGAAALETGMPMKEELAHALAKLRATHPERGEQAPPVVAASGARRTDVEELITRAVAERRRLSLVYPPEPATRLVDPYVISVRRGRFAFVGYCHLRKAIRTFQADRITRCQLAGSATGQDFEVPPGFDPSPHLPVHAWQLRVHPAIQVTVEYPESLGAAGPSMLGVAPGESIPATNLDGLIGEVLALGEGVRIAAPPQARTRAREILRALRRKLSEAP